MGPRIEPARLILEPWQVEGDDLVLAARLEHPEAGRHRLWWRLPAAWSDAVTRWADPFVVGLLFPMMQWGRPVAVEGRASPSLLANLESFMAVWHAWAPDRYRPVDIRAAEETEAPAPPEPGQTVVPFSCGVDSCFTLLRHRRGLMGRRNRRIAAGVVMNGFDIWLDQENAPAMYEGLLQSARILLESQGADCIPMVSNFHELPTVWGHSLGTHLVSGLRLLAGRFDAALVPNNIPYAHLEEVWGSHPVSDPFLGGRSFQVADDGAEYDRIEKADLLADWPLAMRHLRVCSSNPGSPANCCRCEKCIRTILAFRTAGRSLPPAFAQDVTDRQIRRLRVRPRAQSHHWGLLLLAVRRRGLGNTTWGKAMRLALRRGRRRRMWKRLTRWLTPLRNRVRTLFRGPPLGRKEQAARADAEDQGPSSRS